MTDDRLPVRVVVLALAIGFIGSIICIAWLASTQTPIPDALSDIPVFAGGALAAILPGAASRRVTVENPPEDPIPTVDTEPDDSANAGGVRP